MLLASSSALLLRRASQRIASSSSSTMTSTSVSTGVRGLQTQSLPDLPYDYSALEPVIPAEIMQLHHSKHHAAYVANLNASAEKHAAAEAKGDVSAMVALQPALKFNGGGHLNHSLLWKTLCPAKDSEPPSGDLARAIDESFGSLERLQEEMAAAAVGVQGAGWAWLGYDGKAESSKRSKKLVVTATANQDPLLATRGLVPLYGIDVWEHAYYLKYKNARPEYVKEVWKVTDWRGVARLFEAAAKAK